MQRIVIGCLVALFIASASFAAARRHVARPPAASQTSSGGDCFVFGLVTPGTKATYLSTTSGGNVNFTITWLSDTLTQTKTTQHVVTPQATSDVETTLDGVVQGDLRGLKHIHIRTTTAVPIIGNTVLDADVDFVPALVAGPAEGWCTGAIWTVPATTETVVSNSLVGQTSQIVTTIASEGSVLAVGESITVPGGTFRTVKYKSSIVSGTSVQPAITWTSMDRSIVVRQDTLDAAGNVTTTTQLTALQ